MSPLSKPINKEGPSWYGWGNGRATRCCWNGSGISKLDTWVRLANWFIFKLKMDGLDHYRELIDGNMIPFVWIPRIQKVTHVFKNLVFRDYLHDVCFFLS